jgi:hypothetical protein
LGHDYGAVFGQQILQFWNEFAATRFMTKTFEKML